MLCIILLYEVLRYNVLLSPCRALEGKAHEVEVTDVKGFLESPLFQSSGFKLENQTLIIEAV